MTTFLHSGLKARVYKNEEIIVIENIRKLLDLKTHSINIQLHGATNYSTLRWRSFRDAAYFLERYWHQDK